MWRLIKLPERTYFVKKDEMTGELIWSADHTQAYLFNSAFYAQMAATATQDPYVRVERAK